MTLNNISSRVAKYSPQKRLLTRSDEMEFEECFSSSLFFDTSLSFFFLLHICRQSFSFTFTPSLSAVNEPSMSGLSGILSGFHCNCNGETGLTGRAFGTDQKMASKTNFISGFVKGFEVGFYSPLLAIFGSFV